MCEFVRVCAFLCVFIFVYMCWSIECVYMCICVGVSSVFICVRVCKYLCICVGVYECV